MTLGVTPTTLREWDRKGILKPDFRTDGGDRRYSMETLQSLRVGHIVRRDTLRTIAYARVSSRDQKTCRARSPCWRLSAPNEASCTR